jgi:hypothetical protein
MCELTNEATGLARSAGRIFIGAKQQLGEPQRESLFPDASLPLKEQTCRQRSGGGALAEPLTQPLVSVQFDYRHAEICLTGPAPVSVQAAPRRGTISDLNRAVNWI